MKHKHLTAAAAIASTLTGCISIPKTPNIPIDSCERVIKAGGLEIGVERFETPKENAKCGVREDLFKSGYLFFYLHVQNNSPEGARIKVPESRFIDCDGNEWGYAPADEMTAKFKRKMRGGDVATATIGMMISPIGFMIGYAIGESEVKRVFRAIERNTYKTTIELGPGEQSYNFVILALPNIQQEAPPVYTPNLDCGTFFIPIEIEGQTREHSCEFGASGNIFERINKK